ncbi:MAG: glycoside hydrolase family 3 C-terminal domain-containing protein, partial [Ignavibacteriae bacterium]|nr:glycoside hydrolase family 3 C-terminal domain-containing protein [Ignavibacteriota bacterium]
MKIVRILFLILFGCFIMAFLPESGNTKKPIYLNTAYSFSERAADLVSRLTLEEKQSLLGNNMAAIPRLKINAFNVWSEALHGVMGGFGRDPNAGSPTSFPNSVALGASWDPNLMQRETKAISDEARALNSPIITGLTYWSPVVEPVRDPRWGRTGESYGEDPFLVSEIAGGFVRGMLGDDDIYLKTVPCGKHYFANNTEFDRHVSSSDMDSRDMREFYLLPYKKLIEEDNLPSIMSSYNAVNGIPTSASKLYLDSIARRTYGLEGYITGDCSAIEDIYTGHYYVETAEEAAAQGLKAGVDCDCGNVYQRSAIDALNKGLISIADIDRALVNVFTIRMRIGEFDPPDEVPYSLTEESLIGSPANKLLAKEIKTKTPVLLKNEVSIKTNKKALPLIPRELKKIALIGPQADKVVLGPYSGRPNKENLISPYAGIKKYIEENNLSAEVMLSTGGNTTNKSNLLYVAGFELQKTNGELTKFDATKFSSSSKGITVGSGMGDEEQVRTINDGSWTSYDNVDLTDVDTIGIKLNIPTEGGIVEVRVGSPDGNLLTSLNATVASGIKAGGVYGLGTLMKTKVNKLGFNGPQTLYLVYKAPQDEKIDDSTIEAAKSADVAIVFVGTDEKTATEEADRLTLLLPGNQVELIKAVAAVNPNTIIVMQTLGCVEVEEFKNLKNLPGVIWTGYNGQAQGDAIASILFGEVNSGGKLSVTWYKSVNDL